jgi:hypothetical protein
MKMEVICSSQTSDYLRSERRYNVVDSNFQIIILFVTTTTTFIIITTTIIIILLK